MSDVKNVRLTTEAQRVAERLQDDLNLPEINDAARLGLAYALRNDLEHASEGQPSPKGSNFALGTIDPDSVIRELVVLHHPDTREEPYRAVQSLMNSGLMLLDEHFQAGDWSTLEDLIVEPEDDPGGVARLIGADVVRMGQRRTRGNTT